MGNWKVWAKGLLAAALGGLGTGGSAILVDPAHFSDFNALLRVALAGALVGVFSYLKQSPLDKK